MEVFKRKCWRTGKGDWCYLWKFTALSSRAKGSNIFSSTFGQFQVPSEFLDFHGTRRTLSLHSFINIYPHLNLTGPPTLLPLSPRVTLAYLFLQIFYTFSRWICIHNGPRVPPSFFCSRSTICRFSACIRLFSTPFLYLEPSLLFFLLFWGSWREFQALSTVCVVYNPLELVQHFSHTICPIWVVKRSSNAICCAFTVSAF